jgi:hypothetical protein
VIPDFVLTARAAGIAIVVGAGVLILVRQILALGDEDELPAGRWRPIVLTGLLTALALVAVTALTTDTPLISAQAVPVEPIALLATLALVPIAMQVAAARDARRFVAGAVGAIGIWFVVWYPNVSALPLPGPLSNAYQGLLPTYVYPFQFPVSTVDRNGPGPSLLSPEVAILLASLAIAAVVVAYSAWVWRVTLAQRASGVGSLADAESIPPAGPPETGPVEEAPDDPAEPARPAEPPSPG